MKVEKVYWTITEVAEMININASTLRFWESEFDWINPKRNRKGERRYKIADIEEVKSIKLLIKGLGMTLDGVRKAYEFCDSKDLELIIKKREKYEEETEEDRKECEYWRKQCEQEQHEGSYHELPEYGL